MRRPALARAVLAAALLLLSRPGGAATGADLATMYPDLDRVQDLHFRPPEHWLRADHDGLVVLVPTDLEAVECCEIQLLPGQPLGRADLGTWFDGVTKQLMAAEQLVAPIPIEGGGSDRTKGPLNTAYETRTARGEVRIHNYMGELKDGRGELTSFVASSMHVYERYWPTMTAFAPTIRYAADPSAPAGQERLGDMAFTLPPSWSVHYGLVNWTRLEAREAPLDRWVYVDVGDPQPLTGALADALGAAVDKTLKSLGAIGTERTPARTGRTAQGFETLTVGFAGNIFTPFLTEETVCGTAVAVHYGDKVRVLTVHAATRELLDSYLPVVAELAASATYDASAPPVPTPRPVPAPAP